MSFCSVLNELTVSRLLETGRRWGTGGVGRGYGCVGRGERGQLSQWLKRGTRDRKVAGSSPGRSGGRIFFSKVNFLC